MGNDSSPDTATDAAEKSLRAYLSGLSYLATASQNGISALFRYANEFIIPYMLATNYFRDVETTKLWRHDPHRTLKDYADLGRFNLDLCNRALTGALNAFGDYVRLESAKTAEAVAPLLFSGDSSKIEQLLQRKAQLLELMAFRYPEAIRAIEPEYGFHFERGSNPKVAETDRFVLYQTRVGTGIR